MNSTLDVSPSEASEESDGRTALACVILGLSFLVGVPGNLLVIWTILMHIKQRVHTVVLVLHLAAADLLVLITLPLWIYSLIYSWVFGEAVCQILVYIITVCMFGSIFLITLMSVERFLAICHPFLMMRWKTERNMRRCLMFLWLLALLLGIPSAMAQTLDSSEGTEQCFSRGISDGTQLIIILCFETLLGFVLPFVTLSICYCLVAAQLRKMTFSTKQKSTILIHTVVIAFVLCWLPHHTVSVIDHGCILLSDSQDPCVPEAVVFSSGALAFLSSSVNPVLYAFFARSFRGSLGETRLVRLFQELATNTNKLRELGVQKQTEQRDTGSELIQHTC